MGSVNYRELVAFRDNLVRFSENEIDAFIKKTSRELAARFIEKAQRLTPVKTGKLRSGWTGGIDEFNPYVYSAILNVTVAGREYIIEITNPTKYAIYVEYGHRTKNGGKWIMGRFMMTIAENELKGRVDKIIRMRLEERLGEIFKK